jgi:hypothetical protein
MLKRTLAILATLLIATCNILAIVVICYMLIATITVTTCISNTTIDICKWIPIYRMLESAFRKGTSITLSAISNLGYMIWCVLESTTIPTTGISISTIDFFCSNCSCCCTTT